jgi:hypothetical protein
MHETFRGLRKFCPLCFVPQSRDFWSAHASSRRFWARRPLIEKRCEDASHSQLRDFREAAFPTNADPAVHDAVDAF